MPNYQDLGLQASVKGQNMKSIEIQGPKVPNFKKPVPELRKEGLLGPQPSQKEIRNHGAEGGTLGREAVTEDSQIHQQPNAFSRNKDHGNREAEDHSKDSSTFADIQSDNFKPGGASMEQMRQQYTCTRASGISTGLQNQNSTRTEDNSEHMCCVCGDNYSWEDKKVYTESCNIAIGLRCQTQHVLDCGDCWNCQAEDVESVAASEAETWISYDPKDFSKKTPSVPCYVASRPKHYAAHQTATVQSNAGSIVPVVSANQSPNSLSASHTRKSELSQLRLAQIDQPLFLGLTEEQAAQEAARYPLRNGKGSSSNVRATPDNLTEENLESSHPTAMTTSPGFLYDGSESSGTALSQNDQQHTRRSIELQKRQDAKHYVIEATKHLVEMCNAHGDEIDEADKNEVIDAILNAVGECKTFKAAIDKRIIGSVTPTTTPPASVPSPAAVDTSHLKPNEEEPYCSKCEGLQLRMKKAADALLGL